MEAFAIAEQGSALKVVVIDVFAPPGRGCRLRRLHEIERVLEAFHAGLRAEARGVKR
jgi:hypothetical protein